MQKKNLTTILVAVSVASSTLLGGAGCQTCPVQHRANQPPDRLNEAPLILDAAIQGREWSESTAYYANGDTISNPTGFNYEPREGQVDWTYSLIETPLFVGQFLALPFVLFPANPWSEVRYSGVQTPPTYTAMPPLPASNAVPEMDPAAPEPAEAPPQLPAEPTPITEAPATQPN